MRQMFWLVIPTFFSLLLAPSQATAIQNANAKIAGHLRVHAAKSQPCTSPPIPSCNSGEASLTDAGLTGVGYDLYLLVLDANPTAGVAGASFGISYGPNLSVGSWQLCADLNFTGGPVGVSWPQSGSGNVVTWVADTNCQNTPAPGDNNGDVTAVIGALYVYAYAADVFEITRREYVPEPDLSVASCNGDLSNVVFPQNAGKVGFGTAEGYDPCEGTDPEGGGGEVLSYVPQRLILEFQEGVLSDAETENAQVGSRTLDAYSFDRSEAQTLLQAARATSMEPLFAGFSRTHRMRDGGTVTLPRDVSRFYQVALDTGTDPEAVARVLRQHKEDFASVTPDYFLKTSFNPNDPKFTQQWWLNNTGQFGGDNVTDVQAPEAWNRATGQLNAVQVGVLDTGIDLDHIDLSVIGGPNFYSGGDSNDLDGHGTSVAGIIGALGNNSVLGAGINWGAQVVALKVGQGSVISSASAAQAVSWAISNNLPVISMSFGGPGSAAHLAQAKNAHAIGMLQVAAMGNNNFSDPIYPAAWSSFVTAIGALYLDGTRWTDAAINNTYSCTYSPPLGSNMGSWIDFATPGGRSIATTDLDSGFLDVVGNCAGGFGGTSAATPMVSGIASLLLSVRPSLSGEDVYQVLQQTAQDLDDPGHDIRTGWGRPDADAALEYVLTKQFQFGVAAGPQTHSVTERDMTFFGLPNYQGGTYGDGHFLADEYELRVTVTFPEGFTGVPDVWGKTPGGLGWRRVNPRDIARETEGWAGVVAGTETATSVELRTYVYWVKYGLPLGYPVFHWYPTSPSNALLAWTAAGQLSSVGVEEDGGVIEFASRVLENPARGQATMAFSLPERGRVVVEVFDIAGRRVREVANGDLPEGAHLARWNGQSDQGGSVPSGVYFFRLKTDFGSRAEKFVYTQ
jgi:Subtilase family/FlgD Ig-like domain